MLAKKDLLILSELRQNARETLTKISRKTNIPISTIFDKLKIHENGVIKRYTSLIDFSKLGFYTKAQIIIKVDREDKELLKDYLAKHQNINSIYKINNGFDFLVEAVFRNVRDLEEFLESMGSKFRIKEKLTFYVVDDIKKEGFMADPALLGMVCT
ncbi:Lrp/AsnC family transcriptional regulator [Candidatus Woesearchaeota archaeon]|nr:Lrp/AsnC family transcriptional regulator [Candidatus Woesearchaeota archaeon]